MCIPDTHLCLTVWAEGKRTGGGQKGKNTAVAALCSVFIVWQQAICPRLTLTKVQQSPLGLQTHSHPSLALIFYQAATLSVGVHVCGSVCLYVWGLFWAELFWPGHTDSCINRSTLLWWTAEQQAHCFSECARMGVYAKPSEIALLQATKTHCAHVTCVCVCVCARARVRARASHVLQCNLPEAGMWVSVATSLWGETTAGYCLCTYCRGTSLT